VRRFVRGGIVSEMDGEEWRVLAVVGLEVRVDLGLEV
jgi:hypothetical protein